MDTFHSTDSFRSIHPYSSTTVPLRNHNRMSPVSGISLEVPTDQSTQFQNHHASSTSLTSTPPVPVHPYSPATELKNTKKKSEHALRAQLGRIKSIGAGSISSDKGLDSPCLRSPSISHPGDNPHHRRGSVDAAEYIAPVARPAMRASSLMKTFESLSFLVGRRGSGMNDSQHLE